MTYCGLHGFLQSLEQPVADDHMVRVLALFDHEEIGSASLAGAESTSLRTIISQLSGESNVSQAIRKSFLLSYVAFLFFSLMARTSRTPSIRSIATRPRATIAASSTRAS